MTLRNKIIGAFFIIIFVTGIGSLFISNNISVIKYDVDKLTEYDYVAVTVLLEADRDAYQSSVALSQIMHLDDKEKIDKLLNKGVLDNLLQVRQRFDKFKEKVEVDLTHDKEQFETFEKYYANTKVNTETLVELIKSEKISEAKELYFNTYLKDYEEMRDIIDFFTEETYKLIEKNAVEVSELISQSKKAFIIATIITILITIFFIFSLGKAVNNSLTNLQNGLLSFFSFLNKETNDVTLLDTSAKDEVSKISAVINENIQRTKNLIQQDEDFILEVSKIVNRVKEGKLDNKINAQTNSKSLMELKEIFNDMLHMLSTKVATDLNAIEAAINKYKELNFSHKINAASGSMVDGLNEVSTIVSKMLVLNQTNGKTLQHNSNDLLSNVDKLSLASTQAAANIEQTAAALEEITSNMSSNTQNVIKMVQFANELSSSVNHGEQLARQTTNSMEDINEQVNAINDAITVIDQIAFQTNILSLNAAVEAATAGEAGAGFAVVAQEVRNLASRSAQAADEIKTIVENATNKANSGKTIANEMIGGYSKLNENIVSTMELIKNVESVIKEQQVGIEQINNAINSLDKQTQENANVASYTQSIANKTQVIANEILDDANSKDFEGKS